MNYSFTVTESKTFTVTHARHMAAKVATDLKRMQRLYEQPSDQDIADYEDEVIALLRSGYLGTVTYGFKRDGNWIEPALRYTARDLEGVSANDDDPGRVKPGKNVAGATFYSYLTYSTAWEQLTGDEKDSYKGNLPFKRGGANEPGVSGYLEEDKTYSSGGKALSRTSVRSYS